MSAPHKRQRGIISKIEAAAVIPLKQSGDLAEVSTGEVGSESMTLGLMEWSVKWKRKTVDSTTTDGSGNATKLGSNAEWSATAKFAYVDGDPSQAMIRAAIATLQSTSTPYTFYNSPGTGRDAWKGYGFLTGIDYTTGEGKIFGMDITIEGDGAMVLHPAAMTTLVVADTAGGFQSLSMVNGALTPTTTSTGPGVAYGLTDRVNGNIWSLSYASGAFSPVLLAAGSRAADNFQLIDTVTGYEWTLFFSNNTLTVV